MKIEVGMYVRTEHGKIWLVTSTKAIDGHRHRIVNASYSIIDLIQVGDYVNGNEVVHSTLKDGGNIVIYKTGFCANNEEIKSIVTKEQFENMSYKVDE